MQAIIDLVRATSSGRVRPRESDSEYDGDDESNIDPALRTPRTLDGEIQLATNSANYIARGRAYKRQKTFAAESDRDFEEFLRASIHSDYSWILCH